MWSAGKGAREGVCVRVCVRARASLLTHLGADVLKAFVHEVLLLVLVRPDAGDHITQVLLKQADGSGSLAVLRGTHR